MEDTKLQKKLFRFSKIYNVSTVEEAVELAYKFKEEGKYNWFRGQVVDYVPHSFLYRRQLKNDVEDVIYRYELFENWLKAKQRGMFNEVCQELKKY